MPDWYIEKCAGYQAELVLIAMFSWPEHEVSAHLKPNKAIIAS